MFVPVGVLVAAALWYVFGDLLRLLARVFLAPSTPAEREQRKVELAAWKARRDRAQRYQDHLNRLCKSGQWSWERYKAFHADKKAWQDGFDRFEAPVSSATARRP